MSIKAHVFLTSLLLSLMAALLFGVQQALQSAELSVRSALAVTVFLPSSMSDQQAKEWSESLTSKDREVESVSVTTKEQAYQEAQKDPVLARSLLLLKENPLPASVSIQFSDRAWLDRSDPTDLLQGAPEVQEVRMNAQAASIFRSLEQWRRWLVRFSAIAFAMLIVWTVLGLVRFLSLRPAAKEVALQAGIGLAGGLLALGIWGMTLHSLGANASAYRPGSFSWLPLVTGLAAALACFGLKADHEN